MPSVKDLPRYAGQPNEVANDFLEKFEIFYDAFKRNDVEKLARFPLNLAGNALRWWKACIYSQSDWATTERDFLKPYGKNFIDLDIACESTRVLASEDPLRHVFNILKCLRTTNSNATEADKERII